MGKARSRAHAGGTGRQAGIVIHEGSLASLQRFKDAAKEVNTGYECGMTIEKFNDIKEGDVIEGFTMEEIPR